MSEKLLAELSVRAGVAYEGIKVVKEAVTHPSYMHEHPDSGADNQRLEFLGDAVLNLVVSHELYVHGKNMSEGAMSRARAGIVCEPNLARVAVELRLGPVVRLGRGEEAGGGRTRPSVLADALEAVIGAVYVCGGYERAAEFICSLLQSDLQDAVTGTPENDPKSTLQQLSQRTPGNRLVYTVERESGPDHAKEFAVAVSLNDVVLGRGCGRSKREAEQKAASQALQHIRKSEAANDVENLTDDPGLSSR